VDELPEAAEIDCAAAPLEDIRIRVLALQQFPHVEHGLEDRAFPGAVGAEEKRDGAEWNANLGADSLEIFYGDVCNWHIDDCRFKLRFFWV